MALVPIVTAIDRAYLPGLQALHNSYLRNSRECFEFWAILDGDADLEAEVQALGVKTILNPVMDTERYPVSEKWPNEVPAMYWRMLIPSLFPEHDRSVYIDADAIILKDLRPLVDIPLGGKALGATRDKAMKVSTLGLPTALAETISFVTSLMVFDHQAWRERDILARCMKVMRRNELTFKCAVQGVMQVALMDDWHEYRFKYQAHAGHRTLCPDSFILHFMATNPWDDLRPDLCKPHKLKAREIWRAYA